MNERIQELAIQCYETGPIGKDGWPEYSKFNEEKFAQLIVAECMKVVSDGKYSADECYRNTHRIAHNNARSEALSDIKKHFGVEE